MRIRVLCLDKLKDPGLCELEESYLARLPKAWGVSVVEIPVKRSASDDAESAQRRDSERFLSALREADFVVLLDERGSQLTSREISSRIASKLGTRDLVFGIGGAYGWSHQAKERADFVWSLSPLTFPYQIARLLVIEQIYRSYTLQKGIPYHK